MISKSTKDSASISATLDSLKRNRYTLLIEGLEENEEVVLLSQSAHEKIEEKLKLCKTTVSSYFPAVIGIKGGIAKVSVKRKNGDVLSIDLMWGTEFEKYFNKRTRFFNRD